MPPLRFASDGRLRRENPQTETVDPVAFRRRSAAPNYRPSRGWVHTTTGWPNEIDPDAWHSRRALYITALAMRVRWLQEPSEGLQAPFVSHALVLKMYRLPSSARTLKKASGPYH